MSVVLRESKVHNEECLDLIQPGIKVFISTCFEPESESCCHNKMPDPVI